MATPASAAAAAAARPKDDTKRQVKILMLHGFTQSGPLFHAKTRALEKLLLKTLSPLNLTPHLIYPTAPTRLSPHDIPGFVPSTSSADPRDDPSTSSADPRDDPPDSWAWWRRDDSSGEYTHLQRGMATIAHAIAHASGIHATIGFSQGAAAASLVAAALEPSRAVPPRSPHAEWVRRLREANGGAPLRFAVSYSGFWPPVSSLQFLYAPRIGTPTLHYLGSLDTVVEEGRSRALVERCVGASVLVHPGGHHVPVSKAWAMPLVAFIKEHALREGGAQDVHRRV